MGILRNEYKENEKEEERKIETQERQTNGSIEHIKYNKKYVKYKVNKEKKKKLS